MKPGLFIIAAVLILTVGTVLFIKKGPPPPEPFRLMSPSRFQSTTEMAQALAGRFYPLFMQSPKVTFEYSADFSQAPQVVSDLIVELSRSGVPIQPEIISTSPDLKAAGSGHRWILAAIPKDEENKPQCGSETEDNTIRCLAFLAKERNKKKLIATDLISAIAEFHQNQTYYLFIRFPTK